MTYTLTATKAANLDNIYNNYDALEDLRDITAGQTIVCSDEEYLALERAGYIVGTTLENTELSCWTAVYDDGASGGGTGGNDPIKTGNATFDALTNKLSITFANSGSKTAEVIIPTGGDSGVKFTDFSWTPYTTALDEKNKLINVPESIICFGDTSSDVKLIVAELIDNGNVEVGMITGVYDADKKTTNYSIPAHDTKDNWLGRVAILTTQTTPVTTLSAIDYTKALNAAAGTRVELPTDKVSGIPEAPEDGKQYGRQNKQWTEIVTGPGGGIPEAPTDGAMYGRQDSAWKKAVEASPALGGLEIRNGNGGANSYLTFGRAAGFTNTESYLRANSATGDSSLASLVVENIATDPDITTTCISSTGESAETIHDEFGTVLTMRNAKGEKVLDIVSNSAGVDLITPKPKTKALGAATGPNFMINGQPIGGGSTSPDGFYEANDTNRLESIAAAESAEIYEFEAWAKVNSLPLSDLDFGTFELYDMFSDKEKTNKVGAITAVVENTQGSKYVSLVFNLPSANINYTMLRNNTYYNPIVSEIYHVDAPNRRVAYANLDIQRLLGVHHVYLTAKDDLRMSAELGFLCSLVTYTAKSTNFKTLRELYVEDKTTSGYIPLETPQDFVSLINDSDTFLHKVSGVKLEASFDRLVQPGNIRFNYELNCFLEDFDFNTLPDPDPQFPNNDDVILGISGKVLVGDFDQGTADIEFTVDPTQSGIIMSLDVNNEPELELLLNLGGDKIRFPWKPVKLRVETKRKYPLLIEDGAA